MISQVQKYTVLTVPRRVKYEWQPAHSSINITKTGIRKAALAAMLRNAKAIADECLFLHFEDVHIQLFRERLSNKTARDNAESYYG